MLRDYEAVLKAAADPNRARILKMLEGGELCVCQIVAALHLSQVQEAAGVRRHRRTRAAVGVQVRAADVPRRVLGGPPAQRRMILAVADVVKSRFRNGSVTCAWGVFWGRGV